MTDAAEALRLLVGGDQVTTYNEGGEQYEVHVRAAQGGGRTHLLSPAMAAAAAIAGHLADVRDYQPKEAL